MLPGIDGDAVQEREETMAKRRSTDSVYRIVDVVRVSEKSWEDAGRRAVERAAGSLRDPRVAEGTQMDMKVKNGKVPGRGTRAGLSVKYAGGAGLSGCPLVDADVA